MRFNMAPQASRRRLVMLFYGIFGALLLASWLMGSHNGGGFLTVGFTILVGPLLGGYFVSSSNLFGRAGLVEPFRAQKTQKYPDSARFFRIATLLHGVIDDDPELRTDERALRRRDYAHYVSHRFLGTVVGLAFLLEYLNNSPLRWSLNSIGMSVSLANSIVYCLLQIGYISFMTLPQAILLWIEPDMEELQ
jgi:hypothetical protein